MPEKTDLQAVLREGALCRSFDQVRDIFLEEGVDLWYEAINVVSNPNNDGDFVLLDVGCGSGASIEELLRSLIQRFPSKRARLKAIGVDKNPLPEMIPRDVFNINPNDPLTVMALINGLLGLGKKPLPAPSEPMVDLRRGDVCALDLPNDSVDLGYSVATLIYVTDCLQALSEGYRVLKPGGRFCWDVSAKYISDSPSFEEILNATPGARHVFRYVRSSVDPDAGCVICTKVPGVDFRGFNYSVHEELSFARHEFDPKTHAYRAFVRRAVYKAAPHAQQQVGL